MNKRLFTLPVVVLMAFSLAGLVLFVAGSVQAKMTSGDEPFPEIQATPAEPEKSPRLVNLIHDIQSIQPNSPLAGGDWDGYQVNFPRVITDTGGYRMWYSGYNPQNPGYGWMVGMATSVNGLLWTKDAGNPTFGPGDPGEWDDLYRGQAAFLKEAGTYKMWYSGGNNSAWQTGYATSIDGNIWNFYSGNPVLTKGGPGAWDEGEADGPTVIKDGSTYKMWYHGCNASTCGIGYATSTDGIVWTKSLSNPVLNPGGSGEWDEGYVVYPQVVKNGSTYLMWYYSNGKIGLAGSLDGIDWSKLPINPVLDQGWDGAGINGFAVILEGSTFKMWLRSGSGASDGIGYAYSTNGIDWNMDENNPLLIHGLPGVTIDVNYAHDWVYASTAPGQVVTVTVADETGVKAKVTGQAIGPGNFNSGEWPWNPEQPDLLPGDKITAELTTVSTTVNPVGLITGRVDEDADTVSGNIHAPWFGDTPLNVRCEVWVENGPPGIDVTVLDPDGGSYSCDFSGQWDIQPGQDIAVRYYEPDGDSVVNVFSAPWMRVNYGHDWVGGNYPAGYTVWITVTSEVGEFKGRAEKLTTLGGGWGTEGFETRGEDWIPRQPDIQPGDWVYITSDDGYENTIHVGEITGDVDTGNDSVGGLVYADWFSDDLPVECHPWGAPGPAPVQSSSAAPDGSSPYSCQWDPNTEWDIIPGQEIGVMYIEPDGDRVIHPSHAPAPNLVVNTWSDGSPTTGGNMDFYVEYWNQGDAPAANTLITATLQGMSYVGDTAPPALIPNGTLQSDDEYVVWNLGSLPPDNLPHRFHLFTQVTAPVSNTITDTVQIGTSTVYGNWDAGQKQSSWSGHVKPNDTHLNLGKWAWTGDPAPGQDFVWVVNPCNNGSTGSTELVLTDTLPLTTTLVDWWAEQPGWTEIDSDDHMLVVQRSSLAGNRCSQVYLRVHVDEDTPLGTQLTNTAEIAASNDMESEDNTASHDVWVSFPRNNLWVDLGWNWGMLVPGGEIRYNLNYGNSGNMPVTGPLLITDSLPANTTFVAAWRYDDSGQTQVIPKEMGYGYVVWQIDGLEAGFGGNFEVVLKINGNAQPGAWLGNFAEISRVEDEERYDDNYTRWIETVHSHGPNLRAHKEGDWHGFGEGHNAWFNVIFENVGDVGVEHATITDTLPAPMILQGQPGTDWGQVEDWDSGDDWFSMTFLNAYPGFRRDIYFDTLISGSDPLPYGRIFTNTARIKLVPLDTDPDDNLAQAALRTGPNLYVEKEWVSGVPMPGEVITVSLRFGNDQPGHTWWWRLQGNAWLTDTLPTGLEFISSHVRFCGDMNWCEKMPVEDGNKLIWELWQLWPGEWNEIYLTLRIANIVHSNILTNVAEIASDQPDIDIEPFMNDNRATLDLFLPIPIYNLYLPVMGRW